MAKKPRTALADARRKKNLSQSEVAKMCSISSASYSRYETGARTPNLVTLKLICTVLEIPMEAFI